MGREENKESCNSPGQLAPSRFIRQLIVANVAGYVGVVLGGLVDEDGARQVPYGGIVISG